MRQLIIVLSCIIQLMSIAVALDNGMRRSNQEFCYDILDDNCGPYSPLWDDECKIGDRQSPINLPLYGNHGKPAALHFNDKYYSEDFLIINNGHSIQVNFNKEATSSAQLSGYGLDRSYIFAQMHFHWHRPTSMGSEHTINSTHYPMELHLVHYKSDYKSFTEAAQSKDPKALVVLGIFLNLADGRNIDPTIDTIASNIPQKMQPSEVKIATKIDLRSILPQKGAPFYCYSGSLTTPPCSQIAEWRVIRKPLLVGHSLEAKLMEVQNFKGNSIGMNVRPLQRTNKREVEYFTISKKIGRISFLKSGSNLFGVSNFIWLSLAGVFFI